MGNEFIFNPRIFRSPWAQPIWKDSSGSDIKFSVQAHPESYLKEIAADGYNGVWLNAILRETVASKLFPDVTNEKISCLNRLVEKTGRFGIKVYLILHEPRGFRDDDIFWKIHPELKGQPVTFSGVSDSFDGYYSALCSSTASVQEFLEESSYNIFKQVPGLGGVLLITASEMQTHCYSHFPIAQKKFTDPTIEAWSKIKFTCPRCQKRRPTEVTAEIIKLINRGIKSASAQANVIAHTWSWYIIEPDPQKELIGLLPKDVILLSDWERGSQKKVCGKLYPVDEYSFSCPGPSPRFLKQLKIAKKRDMQMMAKIQINITHELASVPYLPLPYLLAETMHGMKKLKVDSYLGSCPYGGEMTPMTKLAGKMSRSPQPLSAKAIREVAHSEFGEKSREAVCLSWQKFSAAWRHYPFSIPFLYNGPINYATAYPLSLKIKKARTIGGYMPLPRDEKGRLNLSDNNPDEWIKPFSSKVIVAAFQKMLKGWEEGIDILKQAVEKDQKNLALQNELGLVQHIALSMRSTINIVRFYDLHQRWEKNKVHPGKVLSSKLKKLLEEEIANAQADKKLVKADPRLGFHPEAQVHLFTPDDLDYKVSLARSTISELG